MRFFSPFIVASLVLFYPGSSQADDCTQAVISALGTQFHAPVTYFSSSQYGNGAQHIRIDAKVPAGKSPATPGVLRLYAYDIEAALDAYLIRADRVVGFRRARVPLGEEHVRLPRPDWHWKSSLSEPLSGEVFRNVLGDLIAVRTQSHSEIAVLDAETGKFLGRIKSGQRFPDTLQARVEANNWYLKGETLGWEELVPR